MAMSMTHVRHEAMHIMRVEVRVQADGALQPHITATDEEQPGHAQGTQALHLAKPEGEPVRRRLDAPRHGREGEDVRGQVGQTVPAVGDHGLGVERPASDELGDGHGQVGQEADVGYPYAGVGSVLGDEVGIVVVVVMTTQTMGMGMAVAVIMTMAVQFRVLGMVVAVGIAGLVRRAHDDGWQVRVSKSSSAAES